MCVLLFLLISRLINRSGLRISRSKVFSYGHLNVSSFLPLLLVLRGLLTELEPLALIDFILSSVARLFLGTRDPAVEDDLILGVIILVGLETIGVLRIGLGTAAERVRFILSSSSFALILSECR